MADYTTTELIAKVKLYGAVPTSQPAFSTANLLRIMTDELRTNIAPFLMSFNEEYYVTSEDHDITSDMSPVDIPARAVGGILRDVVLVDTEGEEYTHPRVDLEQKDLMDKGFYLQNNKLHLIEPEDFTTYDLRLYYYTRPSELKSVSDCALISTVNTSDFTMTTIPTSWGSSETVDIVQATPPFNLLSTNLSVTISGNTITPSSMPTGVSASDYICLAKESCIPQLPVEMHNLLVQATVIRIMEILGHRERLSAALGKYRDMKKSVELLISPRVIGEILRVVNEEGYI